MLHFFGIYTGQYVWFQYVSVVDHFSPFIIACPDPFLNHYVYQFSKGYRHDMPTFKLQIYKRNMKNSPRIDLLKKKGNKTIPM